MGDFLAIIIVIIIAYYVYRKSKKSRQPKYIKAPSYEEWQNNPEEFSHEEWQDDIEDPASLEEWQDSLEELWAGGPYMIEFDYVSAMIEKTRRKVSVHTVSQGTRRRIYLMGYCHLSNAPRTFFINRIASKVWEEGKGYDIYVWLHDRVGIRGKLP